MKNLLSNQEGMGLSTKIALGFAGAVLVSLLVGVIAFFVA